VLLRLPLEVRDLFREWLMANFPDRYRHVFKLIRDTRGGKDYDAKWGERMTGTGPIAWMIGRRFEAACERLGLNRRKLKLTTEHFTPTRKRPQQLACSESNDQTAPPRGDARRDRLRAQRPLLPGPRLRAPHEGDRRPDRVLRRRADDHRAVPLGRTRADARLPVEPRQAFRGITLAQMCRTDKCVDALMTRALAAGATLLKHAQKTEYGGYSGYFADPDGHAWEAVRAPGFEFSADGRVTLPE
jgi:hypothetical protein